MTNQIKLKMQQRIERWRTKVLTRYPPSGTLAESLDLTGMVITLQRMECPIPYGFSYAWTLERAGHRNEVYLLLLQTSTIWDATTLYDLGMKHQEFAIIDASGVTFRTSVGHESFVGCRGKNAVRFETTRGTYYLDRYHSDHTFRKFHFPWSSRRTVETSLVPDVRDGYGGWVVRDNTEELWYSRELFFYRLHLVDRTGRMVMSVGDVSWWRRLWRKGSPTVVHGPKVRLTLKYVDECIPHEVALFLAAHSNS